MCVRQGVYCFIAPSEAPASVTNGTITVTGITVLWQEVTCLGRNGNITGYMVRTMRTGEKGTVVEVAGDVMEATVSGLYMATEYTVQVAAVNSVGTGPYSDPLEITSQCMLIDTYIINKMNLSYDVSVQASAPINVSVVQDGLTSVTVYWSPSIHATGYIIHYFTSNDTTLTVCINDSSIDHYTLTDLEVAETYTILILATSIDLSSAAVEVTIKLSKPQPICECVLLCCIHLVPAPGQVSVVVSFIIATSISLSWSVVGGSVAWSEVVWRETAGRGTESSSGNLTDTSYTIDNLKSSIYYSVIVRVTNIAGTTESCPILIVSRGTNKSFTTFFLHFSNTDSDDQSTVIAVSIAVGAGLAVILAAGLCGLTALTYWLLKRKRHGLFTHST